MLSDYFRLIEVLPDVPPVVPLDLFLGVHLEVLTSSKPTLSFGDWFALYEMVFFLCTNGIGTNNIFWKTMKSSNCANYQDNSLIYITCTKIKWYRNMDHQELVSRQQIIVKPSPSPQSPVPIGPKTLHWMIWLFFRQDKLTQDEC